MSRYVVMLTDDEQGYQDVEILGSFATRQAANEFAEKAQRILDRVDQDESGGMHQFGTVVSLVKPPLLRNVREWIEP